ncbi:hypothetical protein R3P38DRAFT_3357547 [Favolaschia claudopus]|uniref:Uncharacterized protein n=1 Tax=Favolaschia claudopus TaxID=2862362 RepID=A0AAW0B6N1_9AGAR
MSLPAPPTTRRNQPSAPGLTTRDGNKNIHPAQLAGLVSKTAEERTEEKALQPKTKLNPEADNSSGSDAFQPPDDSNDSSDDEEDPDDSEVDEEASAAIPCKNKKKSAAPTSRRCVRPKILPVLQKSAVMAGRKGERQRVRSYLTDSETMIA